jgi:hypothetical protein
LTKINLEKLMRLLVLLKRNLLRRTVTCHDARSHVTMHDHVNVTFLKAKFREDRLCRHDGITFHVICPLAAVLTETDLLETLHLCRVGWRAKFTEQRWDTRDELLARTKRVEINSYEQHAIFTHEL